MTAYHTFPLFTQAALHGGYSSGTAINLSTDTVKCLLISSATAYTWASGTPQSTATVTNFLAGDGTHGALTEQSGGSYARVTLTSPSLTTSTANPAITTYTATIPAWTGVTFTVYYAMFYDYTAGGGGGSDTLGIPIAYWDFGGAQTVTSATFTLTASGSGIATWTGN